MQSSWSNSSPGTGYQDRPDKAEATDHVYARVSHQVDTVQGGMCSCMWRMWLVDPRKNTVFVLYVKNCAHELDSVIII